MGELLDGDAVTELSETLTADFFLEAQAEEAHTRHRVDHMPRYFVLLLDLALERRKLLLDEFADGALEHDELLGKDGVHQAPFARSSI